MSGFVYLFCYICLIVCVGSIIKKVVDYLRKPYHLRWELYPVAHEEGDRASYGGSFMEDAEWWKKKRKISNLNMAFYMAKEILFLKACFEHNRPLWYRTYAFHGGLYLLVAFIGLLILGALGEMVKLPISPIIALTNLLGPLGLLLCMGGSAALIHFRLTDEGLKKYSAAAHFFNLAVFIFITFFCLLTWMLCDPSFTTLRGFVSNMVQFRFAPLDSLMLEIEVILVSLLVVYIPNTHMAHGFMKYFLYHDIRWGDASAFDDPEKIDKSLGIVLNYPITWAASHINMANKKTWVEAATFNPAAEPETK